jgi:hypothetical protein
MKTRVAEEQWSFWADGSLWRLRFDRGRVLEEEIQGKDPQRLLEARRVASLLRIWAEDKRGKRKRENPGESEPLEYRFLLAENKPVLRFLRPEIGLPKSLRKRIEKLLTYRVVGKVETPKSRELGVWIARTKPYAAAMGLDREEKKDVRGFLKKHKLPFSKPEKGSFGAGLALRHPWFFWPVRTPAKQGEWTLETPGGFLLARVWKSPRRVKGKKKKK